VCQSRSGSSIPVERRVRARWWRVPEDYEYSGYRAYLGVDRAGLVDTEAVLRHFGAKKKRAVEV